MVPGLYLFWFGIRVGCFVFVHVHMRCDGVMGRDQEMYSCSRVLILLLWACTRRRQTTIFCLLRGWWVRYGRRCGRPAAWKSRVSSLQVMTTLNWRCSRKRWGSWISTARSVGEVRRSTWWVIGKIFCGWILWWSLDAVWILSDWAVTVDGKIRAHGVAWAATGRSGNSWTTSWLRNAWRLKINFTVERYCA